MSEKTLVELICDLRRQLPGESEYHSCAAMFDARLARAEAAERVAEAWLEWCDGAFRIAVAEYKDAREAVRKLEEKT